MPPSPEPLPTPVPIDPAATPLGAGQGIGSIRCTGICTEPHVHFAVIVNDITDNPQRYF